MEDENHDVNYVFFILIAFIYYFVRRNSGFYTPNKAIVEIFITFFLIIAGQTAIWWSRYYMSHVTCGNFSGSILGFPHLEKQIFKGKDGKLHTIVWAIYNTGECTEPFHVRGKLCTLVIPFEVDGKRSVKVVGNNHISATSVSRLPYDYLPYPVFNFLYHNKSDYNTDFVKFGKYSTEYLHENPDVTHLEEELSNANIIINRKTKLLEKDYDSIEEAKRLADTLDNSSRGIFGMFKRKKEADEE